MNVMGADVGKTQTKYVFMDGAKNMTERICIPSPNLDSVSDLGALAGDYRLTQLAITVPLPVDEDDRFKGRPGLNVFDGLNPEEAAQHLRAALPGVERVEVGHDSFAQLEYVFDRYTPTGTFGAVSLGTSIALGMGHIDAGALIVAPHPSTYSHAVLDGRGPECPTCGRRCIGAKYKFERERECASKAALKAIAVLASLPLSGLFVTGGFLLNQEMREAIDQLDSAFRIPIIAVDKDECLYSGAIGAALKLFG